MQSSPEQQNASYGQLGAKNGHRSIEPDVWRVVCRFCRRPVVIPLCGDESMDRVLKILSTKACCNRCADHHRWVRDTADVAQAMALVIATHGVDAAQTNVIRERLRKIATTLISKCECHYLVSGMQKHSQELVDLIHEQPRSTAWLIQSTEQGIRKEAIQTHGHAQ